MVSLVTASQQISLNRKTTSVNKKSQPSKLSTCVLETVLQKTSQDQSIWWFSTILKFSCTPEKLVSLLCKLIYPLKIAASWKTIRCSCWNGPFSYDMWIFSGGFKGQITGHPCQFLSFQGCWGWWGFSVVESGSQSDRFGTCREPMLLYPEDPCMVYIFAYI